MAGPGRDMSLSLPDGRVIEYWEGGDPARRAMILHPGTPGTRLMGTWGHDAAVAGGVRLMAMNRPGHLDVIDAHWPDVLSGLLSI